MSEKLRDSRGNEIKFKDKLVYVKSPVFVVREICDRIARVSCSDGMSSDFYISKKDMQKKFILKVKEL